MKLPGILAKLVAVALLIAASPSWGATNDCASLMLSAEALPLPPRPLIAKERALHEYFRTLAESKRLISQTDRRLQLHGLLEEGGGLCASTCAVNVLHAVVKYSGGDAAFYQRLAPMLLNRIIDRVAKAYSLDARMGLSFENLAPSVDHLARQLGVRVLSRRVFPHTASGYQIEHLVSPASAMTLMAVKSSATQSHAMVIVGIDLANKTIDYADPNAPDFVYRGRYQHVRDSKGFQTIQIQMPGWMSRTVDVGTVMDVLRIEAFKPRRLARMSVEEIEYYRKYVGQSVRVTLFDGQKIDFILTGLKEAAERDWEVAGLILERSVHGVNTRVILDTANVAGIETGPSAETP